MTKNKVILITGASSGIGKALALCYAAPGITLLLAGRDAARTEKTAKLCCNRGATVETTTIDIADRAALEKKILEWDDCHTIDMVIANAGISGGEFYHLMDINLYGTFNTVMPLIPRMTARKIGHIVLMSSMAGFRGMPNSPAYSTSKVAIRAWGDALRPALKLYGITVSTVFPGFIKTPLTDKNKFPMPFLMDVDTAAAIIKFGLDRKRVFIAFPFPMYVFCWLLGVIPRLIGDMLLIRAPQKL